MKCRVVEIGLCPGGAFLIQMSENNAAFTPHMSACFPVARNLESIVFINSLLGGLRLAERY
jgi:hypothetical protein